MCSSTFYILILKDFLRFKNVRIFICLCESIQKHNQQNHYSSEQLFLNVCSFQTSQVLLLLLLKCHCDYSPLGRDGGCCCCQVHGNDCFFHLSFVCTSGEGKKKYFSIVVYTLYLSACHSSLDSKMVCLGFNPCVCLSGLNLSTYRFYCSMS